MKPGKFNLLYSGDVRGDVISLCEYIEDFYLSYDLKQVEINLGAVFSVVGSMTQHFPSPIGSEHASPFKKVAAFTTYFAAEKPIITSLPIKPFGDLANHHNAIIAFALSIDALEGAVINCPKRGDIELKNRICVSKHFWQDTIACLSNCAPVYHFKSVSLIYEALAYQWNPKAAYDQNI